MKERIQLRVGSTPSYQFYLNRPITIDEKYDETFDTIKASFQSTMQVFDRFTKCRVSFDDSAYAYDSLGKPTNHIECVIESGDVQVGSAYSKHNYTLLEPTYILKAIRMESLTFTNRTTIQIKEGATVHEYTKQPYNLYTVIQRIFKVTRIKTSMEDTSLTNKIQIRDVQLLQSQLLKIDDEFKENYVYDALVKIGKYINRVPVLYFSKTSGYEYDLFFERKDGVNAETTTYASFTNGHLGLVKSLAGDLGADTVISDVDNMVSYDIAIGITQDFGIRPRFEDDTFSISTDTTKCFLKTNQRITDIYRLYRRIAGADGLGGYTVSTDIVRCLPKQEWLTDADRLNIAYFEDGEDRIYFGDTLNSTIVGNMRTGTANNYFTILYYPLIEGKVIATKNGAINYETTFNQVDSYVDAGVYGIQLKDYIKTHGNADVTVKRFFFDYQDMFPVGAKIIDGSTTYITTSRSLTTYADGFLAIYQLNANATKRSEWVKASERIREHGIDYDNVQKRYTNIYDPLLVDLSATVAGYTPSTAKYLKDKKMLFTGLLSFAQRETLRDEMLQQAYFRSKSTLLKNNVSTDIYEYCMLGITTSSHGTSLLVNMKFDNNKVAGYKVTTGNPITQAPVYYADPFAEINLLTFGIGRYKGMSTTWYGGSGSIDASEVALIDTFADNYPDIPSIDYATYFTNSAIQVENLEYWKDGREIGNITYQLDIRGKNNSIIYPQLMDYSGLLSRQVTNATQFYLIKLVSGKELGENDLILTADIDTISDVISVDTTNRASYLTFNTSVSFASSNQTLALCYLVSSGVYQPLISRGGMTFTDRNAFYLRY